MKSVLQDEKRCFACGTISGLHAHHIFPGSRRKKSEQFGYKVWLCWNHHEGNDGVHSNPNKGLDLCLKRIAQMHYEQHIGTREDFINDFGRNYL